jgi:hypothetical protein
MGNFVESFSYHARYRVAAPYVQNRSADPPSIACSRRNEEYEVKVIIMKSMLFILVAQIHAGGTQTVAAYPSLEQCRVALTVAATNIAADYACMATPVEGTWSQRDSRYFVVRE